jgi:ATP-dependent Clp protease ATP-binding subunit ClpA
MSDSLLLGRDLTALALRDGLDPVVGREKELEEILRILCRRTKSNPLLIGDPGVGKTALVEGLAQLLASGPAPAPLRGRPLLELEMGSLLAGTQFRGDLEKRLQDFIARARQDRAIVFIDEIHLLVLAGRGSGMDAANLLKPILARAEVPCIGATTSEEAAEMFRVDPALERRFQRVIVSEPDLDAVRQILRSIRERLERHHELEIDDDAIEAAASASLQKEGRKNPDRAIDLLEDACALEQLRLLRLRGSDPVDTPELQEARQELARASHDLDLLRHSSARERIERLVASSGTAIRRNPHDARPRITAGHIAARRPDYS